MSDSIQSADLPWPLMVRFNNGGETAALMNRKAFRKSRETGKAWIYHPRTGRVLPWPGDTSFLSLTEGEGCFEITLPGDSDSQPYGTDPPADVDPDNRSVMTPDSREDSNTDESGGILAKLCTTIAERRVSMPEGSYTTHLFEKGLDKIRKKTGEEAIELLLARDSQDVVFETADLLYHLLVLLEADGIAWTDVLKELERRHGD